MTWNGTVVASFGVAYCPFLCYCSPSLTYITYLRLGCQCDRSPSTVFTQFCFNFSFINLLCRSWTSPFSVVTRLGGIHVRPAINGSIPLTVMFLVSANPIFCSVTHTNFYRRASGFLSLG